MALAKLRIFAGAVFLGLVLGLANLPAKASVLSADEAKIARAAFAQANSGKWVQAQKLAEEINNPLPAKVIRWMFLLRPNSGAAFSEIASFIGENPNWPSQNVLQRRAEEEIAPGADPEFLMKWFADHPPSTVDGKTAYGRAMLAVGQSENGTRLLRETWIKGNFGAVQEKQFTNRHKALIQPEDHVARLERLLWERQSAAAQRMLPLVDAGRRSVAQARLALISGKGKMEAAIEKVPLNLRRDPGLLYERIRHLRGKGKIEEAIDLMKGLPEKLPRPENWWNERGLLARKALQMGAISDAYRMAKNHGQTEGQGFAEAEWMAGWVALRFLKDYDVALGHFQKILDGSTTSITKARGAYWSGRAAEALKDSAKAEDWYRQAASHSTTYYGQLAAAKLDRDKQWPLPSDPLATEEDIEKFNSNELVKVAQMLAEIGQSDHIRPFVIRLSDIAETPGQRSLAAALAARHDRHDIAVVVARRSDRSGVTLASSGWPMPPLPLTTAPEKALVLALIRQESGFHQEAVSSANARGLMQLLPSTAKHVAKTLSVHYSPPLLTTNPALNI
jgi:soluble lytic murein transglycosylase